MVLQPHFIATLRSPQISISPKEIGKLHEANGNYGGYISYNLTKICIFASGQLA
ncbi:unknown [Porphyromonas sp. CAG:1061]|nr:unknown [Porphyromonas sp. CAG:1061]